METKLMGQCTRCYEKYELKERPTTPQRCKVDGCGGLLEIYTSSFLTPDQLAQQQSMPVRPPRSSDGIIEKPTTIIKRNFKGDEGMGKAQPKDGTPVKKVQPDRVKVLEGIVAGKTLKKMEHEWGMSLNMLSYWMSKWGWRGMKADRAQQLLDEMAIDKPEAMLREKHVTKPVSSQSDVDVAKLQDSASDSEKELKEARAEINRLEGLLAKGRTDMQRLTAEYEEANEALKGAAVIVNQSGARISELEGKTRGSRKLAQTRRHHNPREGCTD